MPKIGSQRPVSQPQLSDATGGEKGDTSAVPASSKPGTVGLGTPAHAVAVSGRANVGPMLTSPALSDVQPLPSPRPAEKLVAALQKALLALQTQPATQSTSIMAQMLDNLNRMNGVSELLHRADDTHDMDAQTGPEAKLAWKTGLPKLLGLDQGKPLDLISLVSYGGKKDVHLELTNEDAPIPFSFTAADLRNDKHDLIGRNSPVDLRSAFEHVIERSLLVLSCRADFPTTAEPQSIAPPQVSDAGSTTPQGKLVGALQSALGDLQTKPATQATSIMAQLLDNLNRMNGVFELVHRADDTHDMDAQTGPGAKLAWKTGLPKLFGMDQGNPFDTISLVSYEGKKGVYLELTNEDAPMPFSFTAADLRNDKHDLIGRNSAADLQSAFEHVIKRALLVLSCPVDF